jgi:4-amino-4-deoxy-L-arabinose transferase-like glycosyltransferase
LAGAALGLAAFNLAFRVGNEMVQVWDESLYAITASEAVASGHWIGTTFLGALDYYNSKPPLNIWLIGLSFKAFGEGLVSLRLPALLSAWSTVALLWWWTRRAFGDAQALVAAVVLATTYGFLYVHSGRTANTDATFTLFVLLTVVTLWSAGQRPWRRVWLGPVLAAAFLVKGLAVMMPLMIVAGVELGTRRARGERWRPLLGAAGLFALVVGPWALARWQVDGPLFFERIIFQDFVAHATTVVEEHNEPWFYYFDILQKHHYDWLAAAVVALLCLPDLGARVRSLVAAARAQRDLSVLLLAWAAATLGFPTVAVTKLAWYLNSFYPLFALGVAALLVAAWRATQPSRPARATAVLVTAVVACAMAEGKLWWHSYQKLDLARSAQSLLLDQRGALAGQRIYTSEWAHADRFVVMLVKGHCGTARDVRAFLEESRPGDFWLGSSAQSPHLEAVATTERQTLYKRIR